LIALGLFVLPAVVVLTITRGRVEVGLIAAMGMGQWLSGAWLTRDAHPQLLVVCTLGSAALFIGYALAPRPAASYSAHDATLGAKWRVALTPLSTLTICLVALHFVRAGVPLFSGNVETSRFDVSKSGLLGIPSRAYLFGLPILAIAYAALPQRSPNERRMFALIAAAFVVSRVLGGLKSGLLEVTFVGLIALIIRTDARARIGSGIVLRRASMAVIAVAFAGFLSTQYASVHATSASAAGEYLVKRATTGTVSAGAYVTTPNNHLQSGPYLVKDFLYYGNKYSNGAPERWGLFTPPRFSTSRIVSANLIGLPPETDRYITPVAVGLAPSLFLDWGWLGVVVGMFAAGFAVRRLQWRSLRSGHVASGFWGVAALVTVYMIENGGVAYYTINLLGTTVLYAGAAHVFAQLDKVAAQSSPRRLLTLPG
jgi:hypothetical protein